MKRLTTDEPHPHGAEGISEDRLTGRFCRGKFECTALIERLNKYENTGLEPEEIEALKEHENWKLKKILEEIEQRANYRREHTALDYVDICAGLREAEDIIRNHMYDDWISVDDRLPEDDVGVLVTYADIDCEQDVDIAITSYGYAYLGGNKLNFKEWRSPFPCFRGNYKVIAWKPLPQPRRPKRSDNHDGE